MIKGVLASKIIITLGPVIVEADKGLLNQQGDVSFWKFCGGKVEEFDLSLSETTAREVRE